MNAIDFMLTNTDDYYRYYLPVVRRESCSVEASIFGDGETPPRQDIGAVGQMTSLSRRWAIFFSVEDGRKEPKQQPNGRKKNNDTDSFNFLSHPFILGGNPVSHLPDQRSSLAGHWQFQHFPLAEHLRPGRCSRRLFKGTLAFWYCGDESPTRGKISDKHLV